MEILSAKEAAALIQSGQTISVSGNGEMLLPDEILQQLEQRYLETEQPDQLTLVYNVIPGAQRSGTGIDRFAHKGMVKRMYAGSYYTLKVDRLNTLIAENEVEAYLVPYGALYNMVRAAAAHQPGILTAVGLHTMVDPRMAQNKLTPRTTEELATVQVIDGQEFLFYKALPSDVAIIRATTADEDGNLSLEHEPNSIGILHQAMAAKNNGGIVIAQVSQLAERGSIHPKTVTVPAIFVDYVVLVPEQMKNMPYNPAWTGDIRLPVKQLAPAPLDYKKVIARRAAMELEPGALVNFGFGVSAGVPQIAAEEGIAEQVIFNVEHGPVGGIPNNKEAFGAGVNMMAVMDAHAIFDFYDAGRLDMTCLGMAQIASDGSINVSKVNGKYNLGGFIDIVHATKKIVFCGSFTAGQLHVAIENQAIRIIHEGRYKKFVTELAHLTFNGREALKKGQEVYYVTERAVFTLTDKGVTLIEIAPGVELERDILQQMEYRPHIAEELTYMDKRIFSPEKIGLDEAERFAGKQSRRYAR
ncbi:acyl CoA:acetate/3-ketoacid CoA transferase [Halalkalibacter oceani]|uniref:acyl CoA:acetate/3-ketoacid CoA transferase n=1 Tax=Halalkalibacter oceani TaxID=1653776 RepID=UPI003394C55E